MIGDPLPAATRVRKARRSSRVACGHYVMVGHVIVRRDGRWTCIECALAGARHTFVATKLADEIVQIADETASQSQQRTNRR